MLAPLSWLKDYVEIDVSPEELERMLREMEELEGRRQEEEERPPEEPEEERQEEENPPEPEPEQEQEESSDEE